MKENFARTFYHNFEQQPEGKTTFKGNFGCEFCDLRGNIFMILRPILAEVKPEV